MNKRLILLAGILFVITSVTAFMILLVPVPKQTPAELADELRELRSAALLELNRGSYDEAEAHLVRLRSLVPRDVSVNLLLIRLYYETGRLDEAEKLALKLSRNIPQHPNLINDLGCIRFARGQAAGAEALLRKAVRLKQDSPEFRCNLAVVLESRHRREEAAKHRNAVALLLLAKVPGDNGESILLERRKKPDPPVPAAAQQDAPAAAREAAR